MLFENGYRTPEDIAKATLAELTSFMGITEEKGVKLMHGALRYLANPPEEAEESEEASEDVVPEADDQQAQPAVAESAAGS
jgi:hypothetical protein